MAFHSIVCIKSVMTRAPGGAIQRSGDSCELNPFDLPALEVALHLKENLGGEVTALSMGPGTCAFALYEAMAMGVDQGVLLCDPALAGSDTIATSTALATAINKLNPFDLVLFGARTADSDTGHVGPQTAVLLNLPLVTLAHKIEQKSEGLFVTRKSDGFIERFDVSFPAALTIHPASPRARDVGLSGIQQAFDEEAVKKWDLADLGLSPEKVGLKGSPTNVISVSKADTQRKCELLKGSTEDQADELVKRLTGKGLIG